MSGERAARAPRSLRRAVAGERAARAPRSLRRAGLASAQRRAVVGERAARATEELATSFGGRARSASHRGACDELWWTSAQREQPRSLRRAVVNERAARAPRSLRREVNESPSVGHLSGSSAEHPYSIIRIYFLWEECCWWSSWAGDLILEWCFLAPLAVVPGRAAPLGSEKKETRVDNEELSSVYLRYPLPLSS